MLSRLHSFRKWKHANPLTRQAINRVCDRRTDRRNSGLANAGRRFVRVDKMDSDVWCVLYPHDGIVIEIALDDSAVLDLDLQLKNGRESKDDCAFNLRGNSIGVDHMTNVCHAPDTMNSGETAFDRYLSDVADHR